MCTELVERARREAEERLREVLERYGPDDQVHRAVDSSRGELLAAVGRVRGWSPPAD